MKKSYLVQRLKKPYPNDGNFSRITNKMAFGGGLKNGGISEESSEILSEIINFDYMGSAEFEWGAIPESLNRIWDNREKYITKKLLIHYSYEEGWGKYPKKIDGDKKIWIICLKNNLKEVCKRIKIWANNPFAIYTREAVLLDASLAGKYDSVGWIEINNDFMFFSDKKMFEDVCKLFEI